MIEEIKCWTITRGLDEIDIDMGQPAGESLLPQISKHLVFHALAQDPAAQQERVHRDCIGTARVNHRPYQTVIPETVADFDRRRFHAVRADDLLDFGFAAADRGEIELVGALGELRNTR